ncbi:ATP-binding cassette domain-containing protein [Microbacterium sp. X-17]|uniref:ATP-binding cassette domain-containing protein n=1 Tax=Microbacterium sp. X-17 TaxID=3144404 RepID=UPI0031F568A8
MTRGASIRFRSFSWRPVGRSESVFEDFSLDIAPGERVLLVGPSGSGKSTLLRAIAGSLAGLSADAPDGADGTVLVDDSAPAAMMTGLLMQDPRDATVAETIGRDAAFGLENTGTPRAELWDRVRSALSGLSLAGELDHRTHALSGGEAQRLALAGALVFDPRVVLLDEPTSMLDPEAARAVRLAVLEGVEAAGSTLVVVEHDAEDWLPFIDRVVVLAPDGRVVADGEPGEVFGGRGALTDRDAAPTERAIWVPGAPPPPPAPIAAELLAPQLPATPGDVLVRAHLGGLDVEVRSGELLAVVGPSGAGKSTLAALLAGLHEPAIGEVRAGTPLIVAGEDRPGAWTSEEISRRIGWAPQDAELAVLGATVREDVRIATRRSGGTPEEVEARTDDLLDVLGLAALGGADPHRLSGGQLRRLAIAGAIGARPAVLVLDEPTVGQDRLTWSAVAGIVTAAREAGVAVVVASHDRHLIALADRTLTIEPGSAHRMTQGGGGTGRPSLAPDRPARSGGGRWAARCGPLSLLGAAVLLVIGAVGVSSALSAAAGIVAWLVLAPLVLRGVRIPVRRLIPGLIAVASVGFSSWLLSPSQSLDVAVTAGLRIAFFVFPSVALAGLVHPSELGDHLAQRLRLPARPVVAATAAVQQFDRLTADWGRLRSVRRIRGVAAGRNPVSRVRELAGLTFGVLVQSLRTAERMALAMDARGFSAAHERGYRRTWAEPAPWRAADTLLLVAAAVVACVPALVGVVA